MKKRVRIKKSTIIFSLLVALVVGMFTVGVTCSYASTGTTYPNNLDTSTLHKWFLYDNGNECYLVDMESIEVNYYQSNANIVVFGNYSTAQTVYHIVDGEFIAYPNSTEFDTGVVKKTWVNGVRSMIFEESDLEFLSHIVASSDFTASGGYATNTTLTFLQAPIPLPQVMGMGVMTMGTLLPTILSSVVGLIPLVLGSVVALLAFRKAWKWLKMQLLHA